MGAYGMQLPGSYAYKHMHMCAAQKYCGCSMVCVLTSVAMTPTCWRAAAVLPAVQWPESATRPGKTASIHCPSMSALAASGPCACTQSSLIELAYTDEGQTNMVAASCSAPC